MRPLNCNSAEITAKGWGEQLAHLSGCDGWGVALQETLAKIRREMLKDLFRYMVSLVGEGQGRGKLGRPCGGKLGSCKQLRKWTKSSFSISKESPNQ